LIKQYPFNENNAIFIVERKMQLKADSLDP